MQMLDNRTAVCSPSGTVHSKSRFKHSVNQSMFSGPPGASAWAEFTGWLGDSQPSPK